MANHENCAVQMAVSRRALLVATTTVLLATAVWIAITRSERQQETQRITSVALSTTGRFLAAGTPGGRVYIWDRGRARILRMVTSDGVLNALTFSPDERWLAIADGNLTLVSNQESGGSQALRDDDANYGTARFTRDGQKILVVTGKGVIEVVDIATRKTDFRACCSTIYGDVAFSSDDALIFNAGHQPSIWDVRSGRLLSRLTKSRELYTFGPVALDLQRRSVYMGSQDGRIYAWDLNTKQLRTRSPAQPGIGDYVNTIAVLGTTGWIAHAGFGGRVWLWNPDTGESREMQDTQTTSNLLFDLSSNLLLVGTNEGTVESWDPVAGTLKQTFHLPNN